MEISNQINAKRLLQVTENRARLRPIIETIMFCGRQNIPLRGHRDDGVLLDDCIPTINEGNFRELLKFKVASGDKELEKHLLNASSRATYIGKNTQNDLISCCGQEIISIVIDRVKKANFYSIIFDETTDVSHIEQLSLSVRYFLHGVIREDFLMFIDAYKAAEDNQQKQDGITENLDEELENCTDHDISVSEPRLTGKAIGEIVVQLLKDLNLSLDQCVGISTDSCSVMSSDVVGAVTVILEKAKNACRCPCQNHSLNNSVSQTSKVPSVRNAIAIVKSVISFFNQSAKRYTILKKCCGSQLEGLCETRWVEKHKALLKFRKEILNIVKALSIISTWQDSQSSSKATTFLNSICKTEFLIAVISLLDILRTTLPLSCLLQSQSFDMHKASNAILDTLSVLKSKREKDAQSFSKVFTEAASLSFELGFELKKPRTVGRQTHRANQNSEDTEAYYRVIYNSMLDHLIVDMDFRFSQDCLRSFDIRLLVPEILLGKGKGKAEPKDSDTDFGQRLESLARRFTSFLGGDEIQAVVTLTGEMAIWEEKWKRESKTLKKVPCTALEAIDLCDKDLFPTINTLLHILLTLPISVATAERSFSTLRRTKTWLRSRMLEERLNGLCLLHIHREEEVSVDKIIERFAKKRNRRLEFVL